MTGSIWAYKVNGEGTNSLELDIYDVVGDWYGATALDVRRVLKNTSAKEIVCRINSGGGDFFEGTAIYNLLKEHSAHVTVCIDALAGSVASLIAMAGDKRCMASNAYMMIHNPWAVESGDAEGLRKTANLLDMATDQMAQTYAARSGMSVEECKKAMAAETWYTAEQAKAAGLIDEIMPAKKVAASTAKLLFGRAPEGIRERIAACIDHGPASAAQKEETTMKGVIALLGLAESANEAEAIGAVQKLRGSLTALEGLTGKTGGEALGVIQGWKEAAAKVPSLEAKVADSEKRQTESEVDSLLRDASTADVNGFVKIAPAERDSLRAAGLRDPGWLKGYLATKPAAIKLGADERQPSDEHAGSGSPKAHTGKKFEDMEPYEKHNLRAENSDAYRVVKEDWERRGKPTKPLK
jgi:ATP-dependent Clp endopeptidase proteolytic subunit ClpP